jgi:UDPglucose--hexose-1-phosphate uridylyltransferase
MDLLDNAHRRHDPLTGGWVLVSPDRTARPWQGATDGGSAPERPAHDPACYLCPGNERAGGHRNPEYDGTFVFDNDYPSLRPGTADDIWSPSPLLRAEGQPGTCRVLCFHPRHDLTLARMATGQIRSVVEVWVDQVSELSRRYVWVQLFENRGEQMGASNPHPHGQLWALTRLPERVEVEDHQQRRWRDELGVPLLIHYAEHEAADGQRIVLDNAHWLAVVPFWAVWPFEVLLLPRRHIRRMPELADDEREALADVLRRLLVRYDNLFEHPFPYSMGWHGAPGESGDDGHWQLHAHFFPPLLRSASVRKFMVGFELLGEAQRDLTAEGAAARLRDLPAAHYLEETVR